jgi:hypothetical protein
MILIAALSQLFAAHLRASWSCFVMAHSARTTAARGSQSSSGPERSTHRDGLADPDETSPLLGTNSARALQSSHYKHSLSTFFDKNAGLSLVAASQFFFSAMNICVKWLNSLYEPIPILEVRVVPEWSFFLADIVPNS